MNSTGRGINERSRSVVTNSEYLSELRAPCYGSYCFSNLPGTVATHFGASELPSLPADVLPPDAGDASSVIVFLLDAFGWFHFERGLRAGVPFLRRCFQDGIVSMLSSQFPSTTAAHLTTFYTGLPVGASGVCEWYSYFPSCNRILLPLPWTDARTRQRESLAGNLSPDGILPESRLYSLLCSRGVDSAVIVSEDYSEGTFTRKVASSAKRLGFRTHSDAFQLALSHTAASSSSYTSIYFDRLDHIVHQNGLESDLVSRCVSETFALFEREVVEPLSRRDNRTLLLVTADHGGISVDPKQCIYLDVEDPDLVNLVLTLPDDSPLAPVGGGRNLFIHARPGMQDELGARLRAVLAERAFVIPSGRLIADGLFGDPQHLCSDFHRRVGTFTILPRGPFEIFWSLGGAYRRRDRGVHGGLSPTEVEIPLLALVV